MSPTLFEVIVAIFVLWVAWRIGVAITPHLVKSFISFWRVGRPPADFGPQGPEKNITPPAAAGEEPRPNYASPRK